MYVQLSLCLSLSPLLLLCPRRVVVPWCRVVAVARRRRLPISLLPPPPYHVSLGIDR